MMASSFWKNFYSLLKLRLILLAMGLNQKCSIIFNNKAEILKTMLSKSFSSLFCAPYLCAIEGHSGKHGL